MTCLVVAAAHGGRWPCVFHPTAGRSCYVTSLIGMSPAMGYTLMRVTYSMFNLLGIIPYVWQCIYAHIHSYHAYELGIPIGLHKTANSIGWENTWDWRRHVMSRSIRWREVFTPNPKTDGLCGHTAHTAWMPPRNSCMGEDCPSITITISLQDAAIHTLETTLIAILMWTQGPGLVLP